MSTRWIVPALLFCSSATLVFAEEPKPATAPAVSPSPNGNEMPLALYQKIKGHFDSMYGVQQGLLASVQEDDRKSAEAALRADAAENKEILVKALKSSQTVQREVAARALEYCGDKDLALKSLSAALADDAEDSVRRAAAAGLVKLPDAAALETLVKGLSDTADSVRGLCATALGNIKDTRATEPLLRILETESKPLVRMQAATALSKIKDPKSLEALTKLMDQEKDERVKMALAGAIRSVGGDTAQTQPVPNAADAAGELAALANEMKEVEAKLRGDRHDVAVQNQGKEIEKKLSVLIEKLDKQCNGGGSGSGQKKSEQQQQQQQQASKPGQGSGGMKGTENGSATPPTSLNAAQVATKTEAWAKLPAAQRDELLQAFREDVPERWRKRLEAYFLSIAHEEAKDAEKDK